MCDHDRRDKLRKTAWTRTYYQYLLKGGTSLTSKTPDTRITDVSRSAAGTFPVDLQPRLPYYGYAASPVHRFYQMWQQFDCDCREGGPSRIRAAAWRTCSRGSR